jgi:hypothetical protein
MSILEVTGFTAKAQVLGVVRDVSVNGDGLRILGVNVEDARKILDHLAIGLKSVSLPDAKSEVPVPVPADRPVALAASATAESKKELPKKAKPKQDDLPGSLGQDGKGPAPVGKEPAPVGKEPAQGNAAEDGDQLAIKLAGLARFSDVVATLKDEGMTKSTEIIAACQKLREQVKAISRVGNDAAIAERVPRVLEALEEQS